MHGSSLLYMLFVLVVAGFVARGAARPAAHQSAHSRLRLVEQRCANMGSEQDALAAQVRALTLEIARLGRQLTECECPSVPPGNGCTTNTDCDDGNACNGAEHCDASTGACSAGTPPDCDDGNPCTADACDPASGCVHTPSDCEAH